jgi:L-threonylcarbamoyladenylate synthase
MPGDAQVDRAAAILREGGVVAFPTETVYGLGANALDPAAIDRIYEIKQRPRSSPLIVHVNSVHMARELVAAWPETAETLSRLFWPGPLTLVLPKSARIPAGLAAGLDTVGIRIPAHPVALALITAAGLPIAAPSANPFMGISPTRAEHVRASLGARVDLILDAGPSAVGIESTVLSLAGDVPVLLRPGAVTIEALAAAIGPISRRAEGEMRSASPGLHARHYAPRTPLYLWRPDEPAPAVGPGVLFSLGGQIPGVPRVMMPLAAPAYAAILYDRLHEWDSAGLAWLAVEAPPEDSAWEGVWDRLARASSR